MKRHALLGGFAAVAVLSAGTGVQAQPAPTRAVMGLVISFSGIPIPGAVVHARSANRPGALRTVRSDGGGHYAFAGLNPTEDYDVWATYRGRNSGVKVVSSLGDRRDVRLDLEIR